jgi:hypothetical protein
MPEPSQRAEDPDPQQQQDEHADVPVIDHVTKQARDVVADQAGVQQRQQHDDDGKDPVRELPHLVTQVQAAAPDGQPGEHEKRDDAGNSEPRPPGRRNEVQQRKILVGIGDEQQDGVSQHEGERDERDLDVVLQQCVNPERRCHRLEAPDQRELQRQDRQPHEAERNREFNQERTARWLLLASCQYQRYQAEE